MMILFDINGTTVLVVADPSDETLLFYWSIDVIILVLIFQLRTYDSGQYSALFNAWYAIRRRDLTVWLCCIIDGGIIIIVDMY